MFPDVKVVQVYLSLVEIAVDAPHVYYCLICLGDDGNKVVEHDNTKL